MCDISAPMVVLNAHDDFDNEEPPSQDISARGINPAKLTSLLRDKFGSGSYNVHPNVPECWL
ncbi:hypothetical protein JMJ77_0013881 [Colletotrichum scovillei]|uniref:Uncharacterized protein n=1 Tax=Colletotrichum scovillei TaxID=1209932 RepID=A0A9P7R3U5_9PEZI|nr:hypothetical protein JMJ77_0013881 [Colletotrichum scovillei]KAG7065401.1 hypothetical protein JMJ78_0012155 [Colletotrichum scovillei]KAG7068004.1 hypothetical protein JMJ76_0007701 [Colletotrichum scovillei]